MSSLLLLSTILWQANKLAAAADHLITVCSAN